VCVGDESGASEVVESDDEQEQKQTRKDGRTTKVLRLWPELQDHPRLVEAMAAGRSLSTHALRCRALDRWEETRALPTILARAEAFVTGIRHLKTGSRMLSALRWILAGIQVAPQVMRILELTGEGLARMAPKTRIRALPFHPDDLKAVLAHPTTPIRMKAAIWIAVKTSARMADVLALLPGALQLIDDSSILVNFRVRKTVPRGTVRIDSAVVAHHPTGIPEYVKNLCQSWRSGPMVLGSRRQILMWLRKVKPQTRWITERAAASAPDTVRHEYSHHSAKMFAQMCLWSAAARGEIEPHLVSLLAAHKTTSGVADCTAGYAPTPLTVALALGTHRATTVIRW
jgi:hypothetical protein